MILTSQWSGLSRSHVLNAVVEKENVNLSINLLNMWSIQARYESVSELTRRSVTIQRWFWLKSPALEATEPKCSKYDPALTGFNCLEGEKNKQTMALCLLE